MIQLTLEHALHFMMLAIGTRFYTRKEIAQYIKCSERSVYRYIETFRTQGFIINTENGFVRIDKSTPYFKDLTRMISFSNPEAGLLKQALGGVHDNNMLKAQLIRKLTPYNFKQIAEVVVREKNAQIIDQLSEAIDNQQQVILHNYHSANSKEVRDRLVEPFQFSTNFIQVWAYEPESGTNKLFKTDRITSVTVLDTPWRHASLHKADYMDIFRISSPQRLRVRLRLGLQSASLLREEYPTCEQCLTKINNNEWILDTEVCSYDGVGRFVIGLLHDIEILETKHFHSYIKKRVVLYNKKLGVTKGGTVRK
ncbi:helix-turn-helix transcriptional regulator [Microbacter margulisiae]|uniref:Putative DNA-binding transcriptional regulator YafY n=1 Tax=Microbacter margulisiae TaxID=1350067 RepID=A0A7W5DP37_9PORP|nr:WYL domain-containing transcriptional regulator [Microbacter margulisiae]MBB3186009.1 putative DNA-binding transcriptional regulator YafY [Microbacter margulisiae]